MMEKQGKTQQSRLTEDDAALVTPKGVHKYLSLHTEYEAI